MLPAVHRMRHGADFATTVRRGRRVRRGALVVHQTRELTSTEPARVGFVVSGAVGNSVVRHRVTRRLRHLMQARLDALPAGSGTVVRALPDSAAAGSTGLGTDLDAALGALAHAKDSR